MRSAPIPFAARQHFLEHGYAVLPGVLSTPLVGRVKDALIAATIARSRCFIDVPDIESMLKCKAKLSDPLYAKVVTRLQRRKFLLRMYAAERQRRRQLSEIAARFLNGRKKEDLTGEELWRLSEILTSEVAKMSGKGCQSTIKNDPQMLRAINEYRCNVWMTSRELQALVRDYSFWKPLGAIATDVGGVERPVLFSDAPMFREPYGSPFGYHCAAPTFGVRTNSPKVQAVTLLLFTHSPNQEQMPLYILKNSHRFVQEQYISRVPPADLSTPFLPMESHIPEQLKRFNFDNSVVGCLAEGIDTITPGTIVAVDPHLMIGLGTNASTERVVVYKLNLVAEDAPPFMKSPSWVTGWRSLPREVNFASPTVFPPFFGEETTSTDAPKHSQ